MPNKPPDLLHSRQPKLAYRDARFIESHEARTLRIGAEYLEPQARLKKAGVQNTIVFFGSARILPQDVAQARLSGLEQPQLARAVPAKELDEARTAVRMSRYYEEARQLARLITEWSISLKRGNHFLVVCSGEDRASWRRPIAEPQKQEAFPSA